MKRRCKTSRRGTLLVMVVGMLATLFLIVTAYITLARFDNLTLRDARQGQTIEQVVDAVHTLVLSTIRQAWTDADGNVLAGGRNVAGEAMDGYSPEDIAGERGTRWLAALEPVLDHNPQIDPPGGDLDELMLHKQIVSSFQDAAFDAKHIPIVPNPDWSVSSETVAGLMRESDADTDIEFDDDLDLLQNVRRPFMDADGNGVPDSGFVAMAPLTETANAVAGIPVRAPDRIFTGPDSYVWFDPSAIASPTSDPLAAQWLRYDEQARYEVAVRVIPNGGMVALSSPGDYSYGGPGAVWNRHFVTDMFNWVRHRDDDRELDYADADADYLFNELFASATAVEPLLRYRGGLLPTYAEEHATAVPGVLEYLEDRHEGGFRLTFQPPYAARVNRGIDASQRFNLASLDPSQEDLPDEWGAYQDAISVDPDVYNQEYDPSDGWPEYPEGYSPRHLLTTISNSDELAREVDPDRPDLQDLSDPDRDMGIYAGQLKFYLGDIVYPQYGYDSDSKPWAFDAEGYFVKHYDPSDPEDQNDPPRGHALVRRLASYYYEMLSDYDDWQDPGVPYDSGKSEAVTRRQQAFMLAVNTVAFAAPRTANPYSSPPGEGFIDVVSYTDVEPGGAVRRYVGYAPQPFITQVAAYNKVTSLDPPLMTNDIALAVELYYPHEPDEDVDPETEDKFNNSKDGFALDLWQFALSVNDEPRKVLEQVVTSGGGRVWLSGRNFVAFAINDKGGNDEFDSAPGVDGVIDDMTVEAKFLDSPDPPAGPDRGFEVKLWRRGSEIPTAWYLVDRFTLALDRDGTPPDPGDDKEWLASASRDTSVEPHFGGRWAGSADVEHPARWRVVSGIGVDEALLWDADDVATKLPALKRQIGSALPVVASEAPSVPLYTMNADLGFSVVHGAWRPKSFPTVGFMLFVPRFSHVRNELKLERMPMSEILRKQWEETSGSYGAADGRYPADFGHMPIFDNNQEVNGDSHFDKSRAGRIPWGLLVFDYFTTVDREGDYDGDGRPDLDPLRVPGRININAAPWTVLAGLPVLNPAHADVLDHSASPAFWSETSGVLVGWGMAANDPQNPTGFDYPQRFGDVLHAGSSPETYRLGAPLAQAAAAYRDRIRYVSDDEARGRPRADLRNGLDPEKGWSVLAFYRVESGGGHGLFAGYDYGAIRREFGGGPADNRRYYGFLSVGELANVCGFDSRRFDPVFGSENPDQYHPLGRRSSQPAAMHPDFFRAVSLIALLDAHFLTTRSNTFTVYTSVMDRENPQASIRTQLTVDRSNLLPKLVVNDDGYPILQDTDGDLLPDMPIVIRSDGLPEIVTQRQIGYFNTEFDQ